MIPVQVASRKAFLLHSFKQLLWSMLTKRTAYQLCKIGHKQIKARDRVSPSDLSATDIRKHVERLLDRRIVGHEDRFALANVLRDPTLMFGLQFALRVD